MSDKSAYVDYGDTGRVGLIYMHSSHVAECEIAAMLPQGVSQHVTRVELPKVTMDGIGTLAKSEGVNRAVELLAAAPLDVIAFLGTSASFLFGPTWDRELIEQMSEYANGIPLTTTSTASVAALRSFDAKKISIATPYIDPVTERARVFFEGNGFEVKRTLGLGLDDDHAIGDAPNEEVERIAREVDSDDVEAIFISCTNFRAVEVIASLEKELNKPVVSAIQATFWHCLGLAGLPAADVRFGSLFNNPVGSTKAA